MDSLWLLVISLWILILTFLIIRNELKIRGWGKEKSLLGILNQLKTNQELTEKEINKIIRAMELIKAEQVFHFNKFGFLRYNPFNDTGGDQSFCIAFLNGQENGIVLSSLHSRELTRVYAKKIINGRCPGHPLAKEERAVIKQAIGSK